MARIPFTNRLKSYTGSSNTSSNTPAISRSKSTSPSPPTKTKTGMDSNTNLASPKLATGLALKVTVLKARNLAAKDKSGTSDPYVVLTLGDSKNATPSIPKTLNPEWNTVCEFPITGANSLLLDCVCWDKDRFGKDYLGEFDVALEDIFANEKHEQLPKWYRLKSNRPSNKKDSNVSGEVQLQFTLYDTTHTLSPPEIMEKFQSIAGIDPESITPTKTISGGSAGPYDDEDEDLDADTSDETDDPARTETPEKRKKRLRIKGLRKKKREQQAYDLGGGSDVVGIIFLEIGSITDLPPERNMTRTSFDMDPFVVASLGKKTYRTRIIRHNLNPVYNEKMIFQVLKHEQTYSLAFTVIDRDKLSNNDFVAAASLPIKEILDTAPDAHPDTGLYDLKDPPDPVSMPVEKEKKKSRLKLPLSRSASSQSLGKLQRPAMPGRGSSQSGSQADGSATYLQPLASNPTSNPSGLQPGDPVPPPNAVDNDEGFDKRGDPDLHEYTVPLKLKNLEKWEEKHSPNLYIKAKYVPYHALRQQFWRSMLRQYDSDESGRISKVELTTMLDTIGSTLRESTIDGFFRRFYSGAPDMPIDDSVDLSIDQAVICLEDWLKSAHDKPQTMGDRVKAIIPDTATMKSYLPHHIGGTAGHTAGQNTGSEASSQTGLANNVSNLSLNEISEHPTAVAAQSVDDLQTPGEEGDYLGKDDLIDDAGEEHVIQIRECPICHQPRLNKRSETDIITHVATCASQDWRQVNNIVMAGFVTSSQAQRKWYSKVITKISYGGYKLGANSANILVQDRITGQINEERMSVYVRLGIRLLYKGLKSRDMEKKRIRKLLKGLSIKQGVKYDDPASKAEIQKFINFHQLDMSEVLLPLEEFANFNEFFYRELKPNARPCSAPENPRIIVSPADCRSVVFNTMDSATNIWVKGREFSMERLLGNAYPEDAKRYVNGSLGIFRLAPQDYHRFHIPVDGVMGTPKVIEGEYYTVNPMAIRSALDVYGENVRVVVPIDSVAHGRVMVICVGAMMVGSTVITRQAGENVKRAEELGYFKFGGSTILLLFEPGAMRFDDDLTENSKGALETLIRVGMSIGHHPQQGQHEPDMRKKEADITDSDKAEAKRRIEGSLAPDRDEGESKSHNPLKGMQAASMAG